MQKLMLVEMSKMSGVMNDTTRFILNFGEDSSGSGQKITSREPEAKKKTTQTSLLVFWV